MRKLGFVYGQGYNINQHKLTKRGNIEKIFIILHDTIWFSMNDA